MHVASMALLPHIRHAHVDMMATLLKALDETQDPVATISVLLRVRKGPWAPRSLKHLGGFAVDGRRGSPVCSCSESPHPPSKAVAAAPPRNPACARLPRRIPRRARPATCCPPATCGWRRASLCCRATAAQRRCCLRPLAQAAQARPRRSRRARGAWLPQQWMRALMWWPAACRYRTRCWPLQQTAARRASSQTWAPSCR